MNVVVVFLLITRHRKSKFVLQMGHTEGLNINNENKNRR